MVEKVLKSVLFPQQAITVQQQTEDIPGSMMVDSTRVDQLILTAFYNILKDLCIFKDFE